MAKPCLSSYDALGAGAGRTWTFRPKGNASQPVEIEITAIDLAIFAQGFGLLTLTVEVLSDQVERWVDANSHLRFAGGQRAGRVKIERPINDKQDVSARLPRLQGAGRYVDGDRQCRPGVRAGRTVPDRTAGQRDRWAGRGDEHGLRARSADSVSDPLCRPPPRGRSRRPTPARSDESGAARLLYRLQRLFTGEQDVYPLRSGSAARKPPIPLLWRAAVVLVCPRGGRLSQLQGPAGRILSLDAAGASDQPIHAGRISWSCNSGSCSCNCPTKSPDIGVPPSKRVCQTGRSSRTSSSGSTPSRPRRSSARRSSATTTTATTGAGRGVLQINSLYAEVRDEVEGMHEHLRDVDREQREQKIDLLTLILTCLIGLPSLAIGFFNINLLNLTSKDEGLSPTTSVLLIVLCIAALGPLFYTITQLILRWGVRRSDRHDSRRVRRTASSSPRSNI